MHETPLFGQWLKARRKALDLTHFALAECVGCAEQTIQKIEAGERRPSRQVADLLARCLQIPPPERPAFIAFARTGVPDPLNTLAPAALAPPLAGRPPPPTNLPAPQTSFVGRTTELAQVQDLLLHAPGRLLTLTGPPGTGKTRLSLAAAANLLPAFNDGVFFVELAAISAPNLVASTIAATLGVKETPDGSFVDGLQHFLQARQLLLVLDNFEQVLAAAVLVVVLLQACPPLRVLVTSREPLRVRAEQEFPVPPLTLPDPQHLPPPQEIGRYEAVRLFVERARDTRPDFVLTAENSPAIAEICQRLDGLPLALELAAARIRIFSPQALLSRLPHSLQLLTGGAQDLPARQRTLRAAIDWSHNLLSAPEQTLFRRLAVFSGGGTLAAIAAVCQAGGATRGAPPLGVLDVVESLVGKSLLQPRAGHGPEPRFVMLEMIREYAAEKLTASGEREQLSRRHATYFMEVVEQAEPGLWGPAPTAWLDQLEDEHANLRVALEWALPDSSEAAPGQQEVGLRICAALWAFWEYWGYFSEGRRWLEAALTPDVAPGHPERGEAEQATLERAWARALIGAGRLTTDQTDLATARTLLEEGLRLSRRLDYPWGIMAALYFAAETAGQQYDLAAAKILVVESLALSRQLQDRHFAPRGLTGVGQLALLEGDLATARALYEESLAIYREQGDQSGIALALIFLGELAYEQVDLMQAGTLFAESLTRFRELGLKWGMALALRDLASVALEQDDLARAGAWCAEGFVIARDLLEKRAMAHCFAIMAGVAARGAAGGRRAATLVGVTEALLDVTGTVLWLIQQRIYEQAANAARERLGTEQFEAARRAGRAMTLADAVAYAQSGETRKEPRRPPALRRAAPSRNRPSAPTSKRP